MVTVFFPLMTTCEGETASHVTGEARFVTDCKLKSVALVGHVKITLVPKRIILNCG